MKWSDLCAGCRWISWRIKGKSIGRTYAQIDISRVSSSSRRIKWKCVRKSSPSTNWREQCIGFAHYETTTTGYLKKFQSHKSSVCLSVRISSDYSEQLNGTIPFLPSRCVSFSTFDYSVCPLCVQLYILQRRLYSVRKSGIRCTPLDQTKKKSFTKTHNKSRNSMRFVTVVRTSSQQRNNGNTEFHPELVRVKFNWFSRCLDELEFLICRRDYIA